ncbi:MAG: SDR family oxidoreductase [Halopseudomonas yangmingensis]
MGALFDLTGKVAIITGSTKGIGKSIAEEYAKAGARVVISSRKAEACEQVAGELRAQGFEALAVACHVGDKAQLQNLVEQTMGAFGKIDILVCNAATNPVYGPTHQVSDEAFDKIIGTNVKGTFWLCNMVIPHMVQQGGGSIVLLSSIAGVRASANIGVYGMSKAAEAALARNLSLEWGPQGIRVNSIAPGLIRTDFAQALLDDPERLRKVEERLPLRRVGEPVDIAGVALFLASPASAYMTGQTLIADGGDTIC